MTDAELLEMFDVPETPEGKAVLDKLVRHYSEEVSKLAMERAEQRGLDPIKLK